MARRKPRQGELEFPNAWGGRRKGAGRKPNGKKAGVSHLARPALASRFPIHVTVRIAEGLPNLRVRSAYEVIFGAFEAGGAERPGFRLVHYSIQGSHIHLIAEAKSADSLSRGMQGLQIRIARGLNRIWNRKGKVFADRFHAHILKTPREVKNALAYLFDNARKHGHALKTKLDVFTSARWFGGWRHRSPRSKYANPLGRAHTWLLRQGWQKHGRLTALPST
jgi:putative transposase